jgi:hypothetical protein
VDENIREKARRRYERLMREDPQFPAYLEAQERAVEKALKRPMDLETRYALAHVWKGGG